MDYEQFTSRYIRVNFRIQFEIMIVKSANNIIQEWDTLENIPVNYYLTYIHM